MKVVELVSGGKDSCYSLMKCVEDGHTIECLANLHPAETSTHELDIYMYQTVGHYAVAVSRWVFRLFKTEILLRDPVRSHILSLVYNKQK